MGELEAAAEQQSVTMLGWSPELSLLAQLVDAVSHQTAILIAVNSDNGHVPETPRVPRPVTALERAKQRWLQRRRDAFIARYLPHQAGNGTAPE